MRLINLLLFFVTLVLTLVCGMLTACAIIGGQWLLAYVFGVFGVAAAYLWTSILWSGGDDEKGEGGSHA